MKKKIINFWFGNTQNNWPDEVHSRKWFNSDKDFDKSIRTSFGNYIQQLLISENDYFSDDGETNLANIIALDQMTRNIYRGTGAAFSGDEKALNISKYMIKSGQYQTLETYHQIFILMPFEHSENESDQIQCLQLFAQLIQQSTEHLKDKVMGFERYAKEHADIISKFGRFPHRNEVLGRVSTAAELEYLKHGKRFGQ